MSVKAASPDSWKSCARERTATLFPDAATVAVCDTEDQVVADLAWDLGAGYVLVTSQSRDVLLDVVANLMGDAPSSDEPS